jgi:hypothetical protein
LEPSLARGNKGKLEKNMQTTVTKLAIALAVAGSVVLSAAAVSLGGATASFAQWQPQSQSQSQCIPHYDSSGAQTAPYC